MNIISNGILVISGVYFALGVIYLRFWFDQRARLDYLAFSVACLAAMLFALFERGMMTAATGADYLFNSYWGFYPATVTLVAIAWFGYKHLDGRKWLFVTYSALRIVALIVHMIMPNGINFLEVHDVGHNTFWGEALSFPIAVPNPWMILTQASHLFLIALFLDGAIRCWRRGAVWAALTFITGTTLYACTILVFVVAILSGSGPIPLVASFAVLFIVAPMLYELNYDMHRAAMLTEELAESKIRLSESLDNLELAAAAANFGTYTRKVGGDIVWISEKAAEILGFPDAKQVTGDNYLQHLHPDDRPRLSSAVGQFRNGTTKYEHEYRIVREDGTVRWVYSRGRVDEVDGERFVRGALVDITKLKKAEQAIRVLGRKLMAAQEIERGQVARKLHDGLNQDMAVLLLQIAKLQDQPKSLENISNQLDPIVEGVKRLADDLYRISHDLHPTNLAHLGLETALRGFCRDFSAKHELHVDFNSAGVPNGLSHDISLCLYRIAQESLQNVVEHSGATEVHVALSAGEEELRLQIIDNGNGFNVEEGKAKGGLGLISMDERVRQLGGDAEVISTVGEGSKIDVRLPLY